VSEHDSDDLGPQPERLSFLSAPARRERPAERNPALPTISLVPPVDERELREVADENVVAARPPVVPATPRARVGRAADADRDVAAVLHALAETGQRLTRAVEAQQSDVDDIGESLRALRRAVE
jgi:hypothetical protein